MAKFFWIFLINFILLNSQELAHWMGTDSKYLANLYLSDMVLPGTYESGGYNLSFNIANSDSDSTKFGLFILDYLYKMGIYDPPDILYRWSITQNIPIYDQLLAGIRYLDLKICWDNNQFYFYHIYQAQDNIFSQFTSIKNFIQNYPSEIIILNIMVDIPKNSEIILIKYLVELFQEYLYLPDSGFNLTYTDIIKNKFNILIYSNLNSPYFWNNNFENYFINTSHAGYLVDILYNKSENFSGDPNILFISQYGLLASFNKIINSVIAPWEIQSLLELNSDLNRYIPKYFNYTNNFLQNIIMVEDFIPNTKNIITATRSQNYRSCLDTRENRVSCKIWAKNNLCHKIFKTCPRSCGIC